MKKRYFILVMILSALVFGACGGSIKSENAPSPAASAAESSAPVEVPQEQPSERKEITNDQIVLPDAHWYFRKSSGSYNADTQNGTNYPYDSLAESETYLDISENSEKLTENNPMLTFSLKVDTASYNNMERYIESSNPPPIDAVKIEEMINYFQYENHMEMVDDVFSISAEIGVSPFNENKKLAMIRVKTADVDKEDLPKSNLTFLIDTSGSMDSYDKLPLLKEAFGLLVETLTEDDKVSIVTYAGSSLTMLDSAAGSDKNRIMKAINNLTVGGGTAGADGIMTAYALAEKNFVEGGNNRIILATDGDFNVGISNIDDLKALITQKKNNGVYLSILGFGTGNIRDDIMETLSANGNGNYSYINSVSTAKKVLVDELSSNLFVVANDVKTQVEFNLANIKSYRLIGYENRRLANKDFADDTKDAGEIGIGTDVVVLFEIELNDNTDGLKYSSPSATPNNDSKFGNELFEIRIRYKHPGESESKLLISPVTLDSILEKNTSDFNFTSSVAAFGHLLRNSEYKGNANIDDIINTARNNLGYDESGYREIYLNTLRSYKNMIK